MTTTERYKLHIGDCLDTLKTLSDNSVDSVVCDPPYGLSKDPDMAEVLKHWLAGDDYSHRSSGFMGKSWDSFVPGPSIWKECLRVLKPGGHLLAFAGTRTQDLMALSIRLAGFQIRDSIEWIHSGDDDALSFVDSLSPTQRDAFYRLQDQGDARWTWGYGSGFPKSLDVSKAIDKMAGAERAVIGRATYGDGHVQNSGESIGYGGSDPAADTRFITAPATDAALQWQGWGTALKPAHEPIVVARKPLTGTVAANVLAHGTGALNIDGCRIETSDNLNGGAYAEGGRQSVSDSLRQGSGMNAVGASAGEYSQPSGRWPANLITDGSDEVVAMFPREAGASAPVRGTEASAASTGAITGKRDRVEGAFHADKGSAARFFYAAKTSRRDRNEGLEDPGPQFKHGVTLRQVENAAAERKGNTHPCVKPTSLMAYLCRLVTPPGGTVLDPFTGSGSTGKAAIREGFSFIGCEIDPTYADIAYKRISYELAQYEANSQKADMFAQAEGESQ